jgi:hypothetical protein
VPNVGGGGCTAPLSVAVGVGPKGVIVVPGDGDEGVDEGTDGSGTMGKLDAGGAYVLGASDGGVDKVGAIVGEEGASISPADDGVGTPMMPGDGGLNPPGGKYPGLVEGTAYAGMGIAVGGGLGYTAVAP